MMTQGSTWESTAMPDDAAEPCGQGGVDEVLRRDARPRVAERLEGTDEHALLLHHAGHGGKGHERRHEEENEGEERRDGVDAIGIGGEAHHAEVLRAVHDEPIRRLDVVDLLLGVGEFLLRFVQLLVGLGRGGVVVGHALLVLGRPASKSALACSYSTLPSSSCFLPSSTLVLA